MLYRQVFLSAVFAAATLTLFLGGKSSNCNAIYRTDQTIGFGAKVLKLEVANTPSAWQTGLSGRACMSKDQAMLFDLNSSGFYTVWMKKMHFPIDIVWINSDKKVVKVVPNVFPFTYPESFINTQPARYILELKAGQVKALGIGLESSLNL